MLIDFILKGGFLIAPILACSVIAVAIILERLYCFYCARPKVHNLAFRVTLMLHEGKETEALHICEQYSDPVAHMLAIGIRIRKRPQDEQEKVVSHAGSNMLRGLEKHLRGLAIISNITPLMGLLGTVTGLIRAFSQIQKLGGNVDASVLAGGIWEALITTAAGLSVAIPTMVFYHYFEGRVDEMAAQLKDASAKVFGFEHIPINHKKADEDYGI